MWHICSLTSCSLSEKQLLQITLHCLGTGGIITQWVSCMVCVRPFYIFLFSSLTEDVEGISAGNKDVGNRACSWSSPVSSASKLSSLSVPSTEWLSTPRISLGWGCHFHYTLLPYLHLFLSFLHSLFLSEM